MGSETGDARRLPEAFVRERRAGALLAVAACGLYLVFNIVSLIVSLFGSPPNPAFARYPTLVLAIGVVFCLAPVPIYLVARKSRHPLAWSFVALMLDFLVLSQLKFFWLWHWVDARSAPMFIMVRYQDFQDLLVVLTIYTLALSRRLLMFGVLAADGVWAAGLWRSYALYPTGSIDWGPFTGASMADVLRRIMEPDVLVGDFVIWQLLLIAVFGACLVLVVEQSRRFIVARVTAEREAASLHRFFAPAVAARIEAARGNRLAATRRRTAVLFTAIAPDKEAPSLEAMRAWYEGAEAIVFRHGGVVDRFAGGALMAVFGAFDDDDVARRGFDCARALTSPTHREDPPISVGLHVGWTVCGDFGGRARVFSVVGDAVNVARRLLEVAEARGGGLVVSREVMEELGDVQDGIADIGEAAIRGRAVPIRLWATSV